MAGAGAGSKGERWCRWARTSLYRLGAAEDVHTLLMHTLLVRESLTTGERAYYVVFLCGLRPTEDITPGGGTRCRRALEY